MGNREVTKEKKDLLKAMEKEREIQKQIKERLKKYVDREKKNEASSNNDP